VDNLPGLQRKWDKVSGQRMEPKFQPVIEVTPGDIQYAIRHNRYNCAIVRSIQRAFPDAQRVRVDKEVISFSLDDDRRYTWNTPNSAIENVIRPFDEKGAEAVEAPFSFKLTGGTSAAVVYADSLDRRKKRAFARASGPDTRTRDERYHGCATYRFREEVPEEEVSDQT
jgi:hypothetical protein